MKVAVILPLTSGPAQVLDLTELDAVPRCEVVERNAYLPLQITELYHHLVKPSGALASTLAIPPCRYKLVVSEPPDFGRSWEVPVAVAHWVHARGHQIVEDGADLVIWSTGAIGERGQTVPDAYHLQQKLKTSQSLLQASADAGARLIVLLPPTTETTDLADALPENAQVTTIGSIKEMADYLDEATRSGPHEAAGREPPAGDAARAMTPPPDPGKNAVPSTAPPAPTARKRTVLAAVLTFVAVLGAALMLFRNGVPVGSEDAARHEAKQPDRSASQANAAPPDEASAEAAEPRLALIEHRAPAGSRCLDVLFDQVVSEKVALQPERDAFPASDPTSLCALEIAVKDTSGPVRISLPDAFLQQVMKSDRASSFTLAKGETRLLRFKDALAPLASYRIDYQRPDGTTRHVYTHGFGKPARP